MSIAQKRLVIIGGTSGIGLATAKLAATQGASLVVTGYHAKEQEKVNAELGNHIEYHQLDIANEQAVKDFFNQLGQFDYLTTPGSVVPKGPFLSSDTQTIKVGMESKFFGQYFAAKYAVPHMREGGGIVFFSGVISQRPQVNMSMMAAVNSAVEGLGRALAIELAPIRVNVISPGIIDTPRYAGMPEADRVAMFKQLSEKLPVKRVGQPEDLAKAVLLLLTNPYMTGQTVLVDGGHSLV